MKFDVEVEVVSVETIKPSSLTPDHLRHYRLSFLDQLSPPVFMPVVLFFPKDDVLSIEEKIKLIKGSLSEALTRFYPLAGRVKGSSHIECNDEGAHYVVARVRCNLSDVLEKPIPKVLNRFLPFELDDINELPVAVQVSVFECGGLAVSLSLSHKVGDALSFFTFLNSWAAIARGEPDVVTPVFDSATLFPPVDMSRMQLNTGIMKETIVTNRFIFDSSTIAALREKYGDTASLENQRRPSRVEALSAFLWSRYMASTQVKPEDDAAAEGDKKLYTVLHAVNLRTRMDPPLPEHHFGNISRVAITAPSTDMGEDGGYKIVNNVRNAIKQVNTEYVKKLQQSQAHLNLIKDRSDKVMTGQIISFSFTSLCRFPIYEADFGWGKPVWVGSASLKFKNLIVFLDTKSGDGIEAWVNLREEDMAKFQKDKELLTYISQAGNPTSCLS